MSVDNFINRFSGLTEEYLFYNEEVTLVYEPKSHTYFLRNPESGELEPQYGVTSVCHIIDKSEALLPWACKQMASKIFMETPTVTLPEGNRVLRNMTFDEFESIILKAKTAHREKLEEAGDIGHIAHAWIENYIKAIISKDNDEELRLLANFPFDERARNCCYAALEWMSKHNVRWLGTERKIYSRKYRYAGTVDGLCRVDSCTDPKCCPKPFKDRLTISDWKTSNYLYMEYLLQTAAYLQAYNEQEQYESWGFAPLATDRWVIRLGKEDAEFDPWHAGEETIQEDIDGFLLALELTRSVASIKGRIKTKEDDARAYRKAEKKAAKETAEAAEKEKKAEAKLKAKEDRAEALKVKCKGADRYAGTRKPKCNGGDPCLSCRTKYAEAQAAKSEKPVKKIIQATIGQWADYINRNYTGLITHTPETCDCADSDEIKEPTLHFDKGLQTHYIDAPVCERCHAVKTKHLSKLLFLPTYLTCGYCGKCDSTVVCTADPFDLEIYDDYTKVNLCGICYDERAAEV